MTTFEWECRIIAELREHLKLCFVLILGQVVGRLSENSSIWLRWERLDPFELHLKWSIYYISNVKFLNKFCEITRPKHTKTIEFSFKWHGTTPCHHSRVNQSIAQYLVHRFINCSGSPHVSLACAGACRGTIMFKIVCVKITTMWL